jgi:hypothetical protein
LRKLRAIFLQWCCQITLTFRQKCPAILEVEFSGILLQQKLLDIPAVANNIDGEAKASAPASSLVDNRPANRAPRFYQ